MLARHLIGLSFCSEKAARQLCFHLSRFTRILVAVEDILLVVDVSRRARCLESSALFERSSVAIATAAPSPPLCLVLKISDVSYCAHMRYSSLATVPKFGRLPSPYLEVFLDVSDSCIVCCYITM